MERKRPQGETRKSQMTKLTGKGTHIAKVGNHPHTNRPPTRKHEERRVQMQDAGDALAIKRPAT